MTSATVPTFAYSPSCMGTSNTRSASPTSMVRVTFMFGKTTMSSNGINSKFDKSLSSDSITVGTTTIEVRGLFPTLGPGGAAEHRLLPAPLTLPMK